MYTDPTTTIGYRRVSTRREDLSRGTIGYAALRSWPGLLRPCLKTGWISMRSKGQGRLTSVRLWKLPFASGGGGRRRERKCEGGTYRLRGGLWIAGQSEDDRRTNTERNDLWTHGCAARRDNDQGRPSRARQL